jgi:GNAT superfamily N-acetyltransferase
MTADSNTIENPDYSIKSISAEETYIIRQAILRAGRPIEDCIFDGDTWESTFHLGLFYKAYLIGVASYMKNKNVVFSEETQYQLRGMAILKNYQKKGLGKLIITEGEEKLRILNVSRLWFNAREIALRFYKNHGYETQGSEFNIEGVGIHFLMTKNL